LTCIIVGSRSRWANGDSVLCITESCRSRRNKSGNRHLRWVTIAARCVFGPESEALPCTIEGWIDRFPTRCDGIGKQIAAGQVHVNLLVGAELIEDAVGRAKEDEAGPPRQGARRIGEEKDSLQPPSCSNQNCSERSNTIPTTVCCPVPETSGRQRDGMRFFPDHAPRRLDRQGTLRDCEGWLSYVASMGFDVIYPPTVHPIGRAFR
jgi:starch synthase (maltosyl-transferring)